MNSYMIVGQVMIGAVMGERQWHRKEVVFTAENDEKAKEKAKREYSYIADQELYKRI